MRALVLLAERAERNPWLAEARFALADGARWGWLVAAVAAVVVWVARGAPSPVTAGAAAALVPVGAGLGAARAWRRTRVTDREERAEVARTAWRRWLTLYTVAAAVIPAVMVGAVLPVALAVLALVELAILTIPARGRRRLLARLRTGVAVVAGDDDVRVGRALWSGRRLDQVVIGYPREWAAHRAGRRDELVERVMWDLLGPPPATPAEARARPDYLTRFDHSLHRLEVARVPSLPRQRRARDWGQGERDGLVLGQTVPDLADVVVDGVPLALYRPENHALIVGATQFGKSSGVRAWAVDGLTHGQFPGGLWSIDGKGSGSMAPLIGRRGVHAVAHSPDEWEAVLRDGVAPVVTRRYDAMLAWRAGQADRPPHNPRALLVLDEIQQVLLNCPDMASVLNTLARQALEANVILWVITQRPDAADAVPGAIRDQLVDRITFGPLSGSGAKMSFDIAGEDWHRALGVAPIQGRALTWLGGTWRPVQASWLPFPADVPAVEALYPARVAAGSRGPSSTRPAGRQDGQAGGPGDSAPPPAVPPVEEIGRDGGDQQPSAAYDPTDPYANRRRRRRRD